MGELWNSKTVKDFLKISDRALANYIKDQLLPVAETQGRSNMFLPSIVVDFQSTVNDGKKRAGLTTATGEDKSGHGNESDIKPSADLNEVGQNVLNQMVIDMSELGIDHTNFSIQLHETALSYQHYKHFQSIFLARPMKDFLTFSTTFYKAYNDGLKSLGLTPQALGQIKGNGSLGKQKEFDLDHLDKVLTR